MLPGRKSNITFCLTWHHTTTNKHCAILKLQFPKGRLLRETDRYTDDGNLMRVSCCLCFEVMLHCMTLSSFYITQTLYSLHYFIPLKATEKRY